MSRDNRITGIVLAGGKSLRMGKDKGMVLFRRKPLAQYSIDMLSLFCDRILISSNNPAYTIFGHEVIPDELTGAGPMAGIASCLSQSSTDINLVLSCDMPLADPVIFRTLLGLAEGMTFVVPVDASGRTEPLCALYKKSSLAIMHKMLAGQNYRMTSLYGQAGCRMVTPDEYPIAYQDAWFMNLNTLEDIQQAGD